MLRINKALTSLFDVPRLFFTLKGNKLSEAVIEKLNASILKRKVAGAPECSVFETAEAVKIRFESGLSPNSAIALFDCENIRNHFTPTSPARESATAGIPAWAAGVQWIVKISPKCKNYDRCANQLWADFNRNFTEKLEASMFPWGHPKKNELPPCRVVLPKEMPEILARLNNGPDLAAAIANDKCALELPQGSRISWFRVPPEPLICDIGRLGNTMRALEDFEDACSDLVAASAEVRRQLISGVDLDPIFHDLYLYPPVCHFSVRRPDLHFTGSGVFASENDEMPGGFPEIYHLDRAYGINQEAWESALDFLTAKGLLIFLVSNGWSQCYIPETKWLVDSLVERGFAVKMLTTDKISELEVKEGGVYHAGVQVGTIWRQFPIFETNAALAELIEAARHGTVRMVPEFAHFGNKSWFSIFRSHSSYFKVALSTESFSILDEILPDSHLVETEQSFPCVTAGMSILSVEALKGLPAESRDRLVLKVCGANTLSARSYGVLMGHGLSQKVWSEWINERLRLKQPFIVQRRLETEVVRIPVLNTKFGHGEVFGCRVLMRPWAIGGIIISAHACAVPSNTLRVHGRVDMAVIPVIFE